MISANEIMVSPALKSIMQYTTSISAERMMFELHRAFAATPDAEHIHRIRLLNEHKDVCGVLTWYGSPQGEKFWEALYNEWMRDKRNGIR